MGHYIHSDFLLRNRTSQSLYHEVAADCPIIDFHNHLDVRSLAEDQRFKDLSELWIVNDPYKHRAMRILGIAEDSITGHADNYEKFVYWAKSVPHLIGNPLFDWTALELKHFFGITAILSPETARDIWDECNEKLTSPEYSARHLLKKQNVEIVCSSDKMDDDLQDHQKLAESDFDCKVLPSLRDATHIDHSVFNAFASLGCRITDHAISNPDHLPNLVELAAEYHRRDWTMQLHVGALRQTSTRLAKLAGPAGGYAGMQSSFSVEAISAFLNNLEENECLPRTILYPLNPNDFAQLATLTGSFSEDGVKGKIQLGPAWWWNDHISGIKQHLETLSVYGVLSVFVGMTTDSRSLLSMIRHDYFRRILCQWIGEKIECGQMPGDRRLLEPMIAKVCYQNANSFLQ